MKKHLICSPELLSFTTISKQYLQAGKIWLKSIQLLQCLSDILPASIPLPFGKVSLFVRDSSILTIIVYDELHDFYLIFLLKW